MQRMIRSVEITDIDLVREALVKAMLVLRMMPLSYQDRPSPAVTMAGIQSWAGTGGWGHAPPCTCKSNTSTDRNDGILA